IGALEIAFDKIEPALAIPACTHAISQYPNAPHFAYQLGRAYAKNKESAKALDLYRKAAEAGSSAAQNTIGHFFAEGRELPKDEAQAIVWFRKAAEQGYGLGQTNRGVMYENGRSVPKDDVQAIAWYRKAADQNVTLAQFKLGFMYENGRGVTKDDD